MKKSIALSLIALVGMTSCQKAMTTVTKKTANPNDLTDYVIREDSIDDKTLTPITVEETTEEEQQALVAAYPKTFENMTDVHTQVCQIQSSGGFQLNIFQTMDFRYYGDGFFEGKINARDFTTPAITVKTDEELSISGYGDSEHKYMVQNVNGTFDGSSIDPGLPAANAQCATFFLMAPSSLPTDIYKMESGNYLAYSCLTEPDTITTEVNGETVTVRTLSNQWFYVEFNDDLEHPEIRDFSYGEAYYSNRDAAGTITGDEMHLLKGQSLKSTPVYGTKRTEKKADAFLATIPNYQIRDWGLYVDTCKLTDEGKMEVTDSNQLRTSDSSMLADQSGEQEFYDENYYIDSPSHYYHLYVKATKSRLAFDKTTGLSATDEAVVIDLTNAQLNVPASFGRKTIDAKDYFRNIYGIEKDFFFIGEPTVDAEGNASLNIKTAKWFEHLGDGMLD